MMFCILMEICGFFMQLNKGEYYATENKRDTATGAEGKRSFL